MKDQRTSKMTVVSIRAVRNGWEVRIGGLNDSVTYCESWVFESWDSLTKWLSENLENNT